jgi:hypothetical protein
MYVKKLKLVRLNRSYLHRYFSQNLISSQFHAVIFTPPFLSIFKTHKCVVEVPQIRVKVSQDIIIGEVPDALAVKSRAQVYEHLFLLRSASFDYPLGPLAISETFLRSDRVQVFSLVRPLFGFLFLSALRG